MRHLDLFSGIGGFALAAAQVWEDHQIISFCEIDPFCQQILKKNFPNAPIHADIKTLKADQFGRVDLLTGGFPCQPFSQAGKQRGKEDDRFLWPEMLRVIREAKPTWIIGENVAGIISMELERVCADLENEGYEVQPFVIPACAVNAPHRRDRVWIVGHARSSKSGGLSNVKGGSVPKIGRASQDDAHTRCEYGESWGSQEYKQVEAKRTSQAGKAKRHRKTFAHPTDSGSARQHERQWEAQFRRSDWEQDWLPLAAKLCRVDDGLPAELDGLKFTKAQHRTERLKSLGNAIVPQVAMEIMKSISLTPYDA